MKKGNDFRFNASVQTAKCDKSDQETGFTLVISGQKLF